MKFLIEDKIEEIEGDDLSRAQGGAITQHSTSVMLNDYPTAQWISAMPNSCDEVFDSFGNATGRRKVEIILRARGVNSMNGIYLGNFQGDGISYQVWKESSSSSATTVGNSVKTYESIGEADAPIRVFPSFGHFVRGRPDVYTDYLYTLKELGFSDEYLSTGFLVEIKIRSEVNTLITSGTVRFQIQSVVKLTHADSVTSAATDTRKYWKLRGNFIDSNGDPIRTDSPLFSESLHVGMIMRVKFSSDDDKDANGNAIYRLVQISEILGVGTRDKAINLIIRSYESYDSTGTFNVEQALEDRWLLSSSNPLMSFYSSVVNNVQLEEANFSDTLDIDYAFTSMRIGLFRAGYVEHFPNPQTGLTRSYKDFSIRKSLVNGGHQYSNRNIASVYSGRLILDRDRVRRFLTFSEVQRAKPFPVEIISGLEEETPTVFYGFFTSSPSENLSQRTGLIRDIDFSIQQVF